jgi:aryl-alcohol dehydrogenase-like predicted oxidoreductase
MPRPRRLGRTDLELSPIGLGCWQFAAGVGFGGLYWDTVPETIVEQIVQASLAGGIDWFDTAEVYGWGTSERSLAAALTKAGKKPGEVKIATKWWPAFRGAGNIGETIGERIACLNPFPIDLYQVHQPFALASTQAQMEAMAGLLAAHKVRAIGVSNFSAGKMRRAAEALSAKGLGLASNQVRYSLLDRRIERNGVLDAAKQLGISIIAYSPLAQGILTGKFHQDPSLIKKSGGPRKLLPEFRSGGLEKTRPLVEALTEIGKAHGVQAGSVALAWLLQFHGDAIVAIPGATKPHHVESSVAAMSLELTPAELDRIDRLSRPLSRLAEGAQRAEIAR